MVVRWERVTLPKGAYRIQNAAVVTSPPLISGHQDCTYNAQFADELISVKALLGLSDGLWLGVMKNVGQFVEVLALLME